MRRGWAAVWTFTLVAVACTSSGSSTTPAVTGSGGSAAPVHIAFWHGQAGVAQRAYESLIADFNASHPDVVVDASSGGATTDNMLAKVTTAIAAGTYPDVA